MFIVQLISSILLVVIPSMSDAGKDLFWLVKRFQIFFVIIIYRMAKKIVVVVWFIFDGNGQ